jgi:hypothetical protein
MKKLMLTFMMVASFILPAPQAHAGSFLDSDWFEPTLFCAVAGGAGYASAGEGDEIMYAGIGCAAGALVGYLINSRYKNKYGQVYQEEIQDLKRAVKEMEVQQALKAANGEEDNYSLKIQEVVPGKRLPNGDVLAPTIREKLILPGEGVRIGE